MAENAALTYRYLTPEAYDFLDATIMAQTSQEEVRSRGSVRSIASCLLRALSRAAAVGAFACYRSCW